MVDALNERTHLLLVFERGHLAQGDDLVGIGAKAAGGGSVSQEVGIGGAKFSFRRRKLQVVVPYALEEGADVGDVGVGSGSKTMMSSR